MSVLITGGAGFIGSNIAIDLLNKGHSVKILDNLTTGKLNNIREIKEKTEFIKGDIRDPKIVKETTKDVDYILHLAALPSVSRSVKDPIATNDVNVTGTLNVLAAARDNKVKRVIFSSSSSVYGNTPTLPKKEDMIPNPISPYAVSKLAGEHYCKVFYDTYGLETLCLRYFNIFGPRQDPHSEYAAVIPRFISLMLDNKNPMIYGDGEQSRDFTFVKNAVEANLLSIKAKKVHGEAINIACGDNITLNDLVSMLNKLLGKSIEPVHSNPRLGDVRHSLADISKAKEIIGYEPRYSLEDGLKETINWFNENGSKKQTER